MALMILYFSIKDVKRLNELRSFKGLILPNTGGDIVFNVIIKFIKKRMLVCFKRIEIHQLARFEY